jgi:hypothetical protein
MTWIETFAIIFGLLGFFAMGAVLAFRVYRNPFLLTGLVPVLWAHVKPVLVKHVLPYFLGRMDEDTERAWRECERRGGKWNHRKKRCE